jgi:hypothetical protein
MKTKNKALVIILAFLSMQVLPVLVAGQGSYNEMTYEIPSAYYQAAGRSSQLSAMVEYDDTTHVIEAVEMEVPLFSFVNNYGGSYNYIAAFGNGANFPWMRFESNNIKDNGETIEIQGTLYFRGDYRPLTITANRKEDKGQLYLYGDFRLNLRDYFLLAPANFRVPPYIDMTFNLVFDLASPGEG